MANLRTGTYGHYYGSFYNESVALTDTEQKVNALYIFSYLSSIGWTVNAIAGVLGNMENESALNPGRWEGNNVNAGPGYGLVQWTPYTTYTDWCSYYGYDPSEMDSNLKRIAWELENNLQYYETESYPLSFQEFTRSTESPYTLACAFAWNYERSYTVLYGTEAEQEALRQLRGGDAEKWYTFLSGLTPTPPGGGGGSQQEKKKGLSLLMMYIATRR